MDERAPGRLLATPSWLVGQTAVQSRRIIGAAFAAAEASGYHYRLLLSLAEFGPASQATLGRRTGIDRSDVVAALNELSTAGYVDREIDPDDRRRNIITLTAAGRRQLERLDRFVEAAQEELFAPLSAAERGQLTRLLARVVEHHAQAD
ncbi:MarR family winged helix-turn-helix transcriptional regulator [Kribbella deserti]|uniref:MarR family winged helix-turn-helix transcriptional regulator n=1 Tax=Kribbella deserti TaxID=1926257 RepID=A0ABV6QHR6_9ACTN